MSVEGPKATKPMKPAVHSIRTVIEAPQPVKRKAPVDSPIRRRRKKISADRLTKAVDNYGKSTAELAEDLAKEMSFTPPEQKNCQKLGIRVGQRHIFRKIRKKMPLHAGKTDGVKFLRWLEETISEVETRSSDEIVE